MNEGILFAIMIVLWFSSFFFGGRDSTVWVLRAFLTIAVVLLWLEVGGVIDIIPNPPPSFQ